MTQAVLALADGTVFYGRALGVQGTTVGEVVFNTALSGYQEILSDPSYCGQIITLTAAHIGNTGCNHEDMEALRCHAAGLVIRDYPRRYSNWRAEHSLEAFLQQQGLVAICDLDTRRLTRHLRHHGAMPGCVISAPYADLAQQREHALAQARACPSMAGRDLAQLVTTNSSYSWQQRTWQAPAAQRHNACHHHAAQQHSGEASGLHVVAYDFGVKHNILRLLADRGCRITVVPAQTSANAVLALRPDGVFLSNGPGDPQACDYAITALRQLLRQQIPLFGICLGHQLLALAAGAQTSKMKFGHHGANHPVQEVATGRVLITSQNHGFAVDEDSLPATLRVTHRSLFDGSVQGIACEDYPAFGFQGHPEASPGPHDAALLFDQFMHLMANQRQSVAQA